MSLAHERGATPGCNGRARPSVAPLVVLREVVLVDELLDNGKTMFEMKQHFLSVLSGTHTENDILTARRRGGETAAAAAPQTPLGRMCELAPRCCGQRSFSNEACAKSG